MDPNFKRLLKELCKKLPEILDKEHIEHYTYNNRISFSCPIHGSNNSESACVFTEESRLGLIGNWKCFTHGCEDQIGKSVYSLLKEYYCIVNNWDKRKSDEYVRSLVTFDKVTFNASNEEFIRQVKILQKPIIDFEKTFDRHVLKKLKTPSEYYQNRGFNKSTLEKFEVGDCSDEKAKFRNRSIIPVFNLENDKVVNFIARSVYDKCNLCDKYHQKGTYCPVTDIQKFYSSKWLNFSHLGNTFYNLWHSRKFIEEESSCILVESASDVWRLDECGIKNSLALLTNNISYQQQIILETLPITTVTLCLDNDDAGQTGIQNIINKLSRMYTLKILIPHKKDLTEMNQEEVKRLFGVCS
jgi:5S rRNA maturation endonuclease (ribonuclease M5)